MQQQNAPGRGQKVLFLTVVDMSLSNLKGQNKDVLLEFASLGAEVVLLSCRDPSIRAHPEVLSQFNVAILWTCAQYNFHFLEFT